MPEDQAALNFALRVTYGAVLTEEEKTLLGRLTMDDPELQWLLGVIRSTQEKTPADESRESTMSP